MLTAMTPAVKEATRQQVVLIAEDEVLIRSPVAEYLRISGFKVVEVANATEAIEVLVAGTVIDLVFSDIEMPGPMDGVGLARWMSRHHPSIPVVLTSSINHSARTTEMAALFLRKPYHLSEVTTHIRSLLEAPQ
jgi:CheY-like chemotaxis protein